ncbi:MAG: biotin/lipoyl-containing protein, partial [Methyloceanibacter sp.]
MATEIRVPSLGESVVEATVGQWFKEAGDAVKADEPLVELETDKVTIEVPAPAAGVLAEIAVKSGETVAVGAVLGTIGDGVGRAKPAKAKQPQAAEPPAPAPAPAPKAPPTEPKKLEREPSPREEIGLEEMPPSPAARKLLVESDLGPGEVIGSGRRGQVLKDDVAKAVEALRTRAPKEKAPPPPRAAVASDDAAREERVRMSRLRQTIAKR